MVGLGEFRNNFMVVDASSFILLYLSLSPGEWTSRIIHLLNDQHMGVVTAAVSLIDALSKKAPDEYKGCVPLAVSRLSRIVTSSYTGSK